MQQGLEGKRVLLTGGTKGIGRATALAFARAGAQVATCHNQADEAARDLAREFDQIGGEHLLIRGDVTNSNDVRRVVDEAAEAFGGFDVLVNNVGVDGVVPFDDLDISEWNRVLEHNTTSVYLVTQAAQAHLADGGSIVTIGSSVALRGRVMGVHYTTAKAALIGFTRALSKELGTRGIRVNLVSPALTETEPGAGLPPQAVERIVGLTALGRICQPDDVAGAVLFLAGDTSRYVSGATLNVDGGI